jgi:hypothetical protein
MLEAIDEKLKRWRPPPRSLGAGSSRLRDAARQSADERAEPRSSR